MVGTSRYAPVFKTFFFREKLIFCCYFTFGEEPLFESDRPLDGGILMFSLPFSKDCANAENKHGNYA